MTAVPASLETFAAVVGDRLDGSPLALMLDIDGTLAPIAPTPSDAVVPVRTRQTLRRLIALPRVTVALVSGRSAEDAHRMAGVEETWVIGNHGLESRAPDGTVTVEESVLSYEAPLSAAARLLAVEAAAIPGAFVEHKRWTLSVHYRLAAPDQVPQLMEAARAAAASLGLRVTEGRMVVEVRPPLDVNKGTAAVAFARQLKALAGHGSALYAGDDRTDEDAFRALRKSDPRAVTVRVIAERDGAERSTSAEFALGSTDELRDALDWLVARRTRAMADA